MSDRQIRRATVADADALARAYRSAYRENRELGFPAKAESADEDDVREWIQECRVYVAEREGEVVAGVRLEATGPDRAKLSRLGVHERWKGEGIGSALLDHAEARVRDCGYGTLWLTTPEDHPFLPGFYRRRGYEVTGEYPLDFREYDEVVMEKRLD